MTTEPNHEILIIEDSDEDFEAVRWALRGHPQNYCFRRFITCDEAIDYLQSAPIQPALILLDLNLNGTGGHETLKTIKHDEKLCIIPVIVLTTSTDPKDIEFCYRNGAAGFVNKPVNFEKFSRSMRLLMDYWLEAVMLPEV